MGRKPVVARLRRLLKNLQFAVHPIKERIMELKYLDFKPSGGRRGIGIMRVDGRVYHGGLNDRFKGAISFWNYCQKNGLDFRIHYIYPFNLTDYVIPNEHDWRIDQKEIPSSIHDTRIILGRGESGKRLDRLKTTKNIWYYGNIDISKTLRQPPYDTPWSESFHKLFRPSPLLENHLEKCRAEIGGDYIAVVYRFQNLLGDYNEYSYRTIQNEDKATQLINRSLEELEKIHQENPGMRVLVTSDSSRFLGMANRKDYVYIIPGKLEHMDCIATDTDHRQLKSFLDYFMISEARKVYSVVIGDMYKSDFPEYAAKINDVPFIRITAEN